MGVTFREARDTDCGLILSFIKGLAAYEKMSDEVVATEERLKEWLFGKKKAEVLLVCADGKEVGFALYFHNFSTFLGRAGIYLEDLYILPEYRGRGYGKAALKKLAQIAVQRGCGRLEWACLDWNQPSIDFYLSLGAKPMDEWTVYRVTGETLTKLAGEDDAARSDDRLYGRALAEIENLDPAGTALLMIDMQKGFVEPGAALEIEGAKATVPACQAALADARNLGIRIIWIKREYSPDGSDMEIPRRKMLEAKGITGVLSPGSTGINSPEEAEGLVRRDDEMVVVKPRWSAFFGTGLDGILKDLGITTVILAGTTTPNCIRTTCYDAIAYDYRTLILEKCTSSRTADIQKTNIEDMRRAGAEIIE